MTQTISVTRLRIRRKRFLPAFLFHTMRSQRQLRRSNGFVAAYLAIGPKLTFWTVSAWHDPQAMRTFRRTGAHLKAMPKLLDWCDEAAVATLSDGAAGLPEPAEAARRLQEEGRISKVRNPSPAHSRGELWPDGRVPRAAPQLKPV